MVNLTVLNLGGNNFSGTIPSNVASCSKLVVLNLARNKLTGQIPESFKNFESLSFLSLSSCNFSNLPTTLKILQYCPKLTILSLTMNFYNEQLLTDDDLQFRSLKALVIANCRLKGSIPSWLNSLTQLQLLDLSFNHLTGMIPAYLESMISREISLEEPSPEFPFFKIYVNMSGRGSSLRNESMRFPSLLDLSNNLLTGPILPEFGKLIKLHVLDLNHNRLSGTIPSSLSGMRNIESLDLSYNNLTGTIPPSWVELTFLSELSVAYNNLTGVIPTGGQLSTFSNSSFAGNPGLCGDFFMKCKKNQYSLQTPASEDEEDDDDFFILRFLVLIGFGSGFLLTVISLLDFPIYMSRNVISNTWMTLQYDEIIAFPLLLDLSNNLLTRPIWPEFGNLKKLSVLDLKHNNLSGTIPSSLSSLRNIETLDMSYNSLTGTVPLSFGNLHFLSKFSVAHNDLTGSIPSIGQFQTFSIASFEGNSGLCGKYLLKCEKTQVLLETPAASKDEEDSIARVLAFIGFGTGFLVTVFYLLVVPRLIKGYTHS
ncbi:hypothetical protein L1987_77167 [Smallanthus sonchifolius]|uniref:Uncharacterized protein n=1 Tax=Smallanthus sonchifolius TaxID=185202 RepID=A0ACB8Z920_9ASTR|nr:hypothetical protein L1987_77167 [Smallanthus sonchifolius]